MQTATEPTARDTAAHRRFLNQYYGPSRYIYDITRKYYLFGRDQAIDQLIHDPQWSHLVEIGPGTGRNLRKLHARRPDTLLGGIEACDEMLAHAQQKCPWAKLVHGFAESTSVQSVLRVRPERVLFSYCLSMVNDPEAALENARRSITKTGSVLVVDFADQGEFPGWIRGPLRLWLKTFHVQPDRLTSVFAKAQTVLYGPGRYYAIARFGPIETRN